MIKRFGWATGLTGLLAAVVSMGCLRGGTTVVSGQGSTYVVVRRLMRSDVYYCSATAAGRPVCTITTEQ